MNAEPITPPETARFAGRPPAAAWVLLGLAVITVAVGIGTRGMTGPYLILDLSQLASLLDLAAAFLLAAGVIMGAERWGMTRRTVLLVVALLSLRGILEVAREAWLQWWFGVASGPSDIELTLLPWSGFVSLVAFIAAMVLLAIAVWGSEPQAMSAARRGAAMAIGLVGAVAAGSAFAEAVRIPATNGYVFWGWLGQGMLAVQAAAIAFLGVAAVRRIPRRHRLPELLIAGGAALVLAATAWSGWFNQITRLDVPREWWTMAIYLPGWASVVGLLAVAAGFASARLFPIPDRRV